MTVSLDEGIAGMAPTYRGQLLQIGQIGSLVRIPQGLVDLIAIVNLVSISELVAPLEPAHSIQKHDRWIQVQLLGQIDHSTSKFERGVSCYPGLEDPVHFATAEHLRSVYPVEGNMHCEIGYLSSAESVPVSVDVGKLVLRHSAVVGATGSGKSSTVASIVQSIVSSGFGAANIVLIDPHGEYAQAFPGIASIRSVLHNQVDKRLRVPYWALSASDILRIFVGSSGNAPFQRKFAELVTEARKDFVREAIWLNLDPLLVTANTPVPFNIRKVWLQIDGENRETRQNKQDPTTAAIIDAGDPARLRPKEFAPYNPGSAAPFKADSYGASSDGPDLLRLGLQDPRLAFFQEPAADPSGEDSLLEVLTEWLGGSKPVSVLDFSGVPSEAADLAVGVVLNLLFEVCLRGKYDTPGIGRPSPVLFIVEEAHRYLGDGSSKLAREAINRIAREGRKYGVGLMLVSQGPLSCLRLH